MKQPAFWFQKKSKIGALLAPLGAFYAWTIKRRFKKTTPYKGQLPLICVGNLNVGGTGKTPFCLALAGFLEKQGKKVCFLNHGYKCEKQNVFVDLKNPIGVCDEALLLAKRAPTLVCKNRAEGLKTLEQTDYNVVVMDDGFQNPSVKKDLSFLVFDGRLGVGNGYCLPVGPLRESLEDGLKRANAVVIVGADQTKLCDSIRKIDSRMPILFAKVESDADLSKLSGIAFAGLGRPEKFFDMLRAGGAKLTETIVFPDHYMYSEADIEKMLKKNKHLITTEKDIVKIPEKYHSQITVVKIRFVFDNESELINLLKDI